MEDRGRELPTPTLPPIVDTTPPHVSAKQLHAAQKRLAKDGDIISPDAHLIGSWVTVTGVIEKVDDGEVILLGHGSTYLDVIALKGLAQETLASVTEAQEFTATCTVGEYHVGTLHLHDCRPAEAP